MNTLNRHSLTVGPLLILIPLKPLARAKGRLAGVLANDDRRVLVERFFAHVVATARAARVPAHIGVIAGDGEAAALAREQGVAVLAEADPWRVEVADVGSGDLVADEGQSVEARLNRALADALAWAEEQGYAAALILPADLPLLTAEDVRALWERSRGLPAPHIVIAPDARDQGTNALLLRPPTCLTPAFGRDSFRRHLHLTRAASLAIAIVRSPGLAHDVDTPADLEELKVENR